MLGIASAREVELPPYPRVGWLELCCALGLVVVAWLFFPPVVPLIIGIAVVKFRQRTVKSAARWWDVAIGRVTAEKNSVARWARMEWLKTQSIRSK